MKNLAIIKQGKVLSAKEILEHRERLPIVEYHPVLYKFINTFAVTSVREDASLEASLMAALALGIFLGQGGASLAEVTNSK